MLTQLNVWKNKLLDLGKRNRMLNFLPAQTTTLKVLQPDIDILFDGLLNFGIYEVAGFVSDDGTEKDKVVGKVKKTIIAEGKDIDCRKVLYRLRGKAKEAIEEQGINLLYLAFGFVRWHDDKWGKQEFSAPLVLLPVKVTVESFRTPYRISLYEEDIIVNPTLKYKLKESFNIELPEYTHDSDTTITEYLQIVQTLLKSLKWMVEKDVYLGFFSFAKLIMYMDVAANSQQMLQNPLIQAFCGENNGEISFDADKWIDLDNQFDAENTFCVVDADSSQLEAIHYAKNGKSFILQGPPGTGKSQTITNIISTLIADGKKVLFVAEKQAALEVVYSNLRKVGLGDFCLQLHSHKANKRDVIAELCDTLNKPKTAAQKSVMDDLAELEKTKKYLNSYAGVLGREISELGISTYELFGMVAKYSQYPDIKFDIDKQQLPDRQTLNTNVELINRYIDFMPTIGYDYRENQHYGFIGSNSSFDKTSQINKLYLDTLQQIREFDSLAKQIEKEFNVFVPTTLEALERLSKLISVISMLDEPQESWFNTQIVQPLAEKVRYLEGHIVNSFGTQEIVNKVSQKFYDLDIDGLLFDFLHSYKGTLRIFNGGYKRAIRQISQSFGSKVGYSQAVDILTKVKKHKDAEAFLAANSQYFCQHLGVNYNGKETNCNKIISQLERIIDCLLLVKEFGKSALGKAIAMHNNSQRKTLCLNYLANLSALKQLFEKTQELFDNKIVNFKKHGLDVLREKLEDGLDNLGRLSDWISFRKLQSELADNKILGAVESFTAEGLVSEQFVGAYLRKAFNMWLDEICDFDTLLKTFTREKQDAVIKLFCLKDKLQLKIAQARIRERLSAMRPNVNSAAQNSEVAILTREGEKKRKHMPIRKLLSSIENLLPRLKPCLLMSPMSVSSFLSPAAQQFDAVIFDEASQIFPEDALVAIYRGKQIIIVGDSLQLPPTNFFNLTQDDSFDGEYEEAADTSFESILDIGSTFLNKVKLKWHYRSKIEELIAFSNNKIYSGGLVTFPPPQKKVADKGVEYIFVENAIYDRSGTRSNKAEAEKILQLIIQHAQKYPSRSLGVVAFSQAQAETIDGEINNFRRKDSGYEEFFCEDKTEPFFVKNIESVQGDERDTIIFSIGYGKDANGKMFNNFGPLMREGGERRLNVAITRAKINVKLVGSILPNDISSSSTRQGVRLLRSYIQFAIDGTLLENITASNFDDMQTALESSVAEEIEKAGYKVERGVGKSNFKIDLAVVNPDDEKSYLLGIECDGQPYYTGRTARDRDRLRRQVLESLGWKMYRIWSVDWIKRRDTEVKKMLEAIREAIKKTAGNAIEAVESKPQNEKKIVETIMEEKPIKAVYKPYVAVDFDKLKVTTVEAKLRAIVSAEAPIHHELLLKRACTVFNREKVTVFVCEQLNLHWEKAEKYGFFREGDFYFDKNNKQQEFRISVANEETRKVEHVHPNELLDGIEKVVKNNVGITRAGIAAEILRLLGYKRINDNQVTIVVSAIDVAVKSGRIEKRNNSYFAAQQKAE